MHFEGWLPMTSTRLRRQLQSIATKFRSCLRCLPPNCLPEANIEAPEPLWKTWLHLQRLSCDRDRSPDLVGDRAATRFSDSSLRALIACTNGSHAASGPLVGAVQGHPIGRHWISWLECDVALACELRFGRPKQRFNSHCRSCNGT